MSYYYNPVQEGFVLDGPYGFPFSGLFEPGASWETLIYDVSTGIPRYPGVKQTWRLMFEYYFPTTKWVWNNLPEDHFRKVYAQLVFALGGIDLDLAAPFPFQTADEVLHAIDAYLAANYDPANTEVFEGLSKKAWRERAMNSIAGLTQFFTFILNNTGIYMGWFSGRIGCPLNLTLTSAADSLVHFKGSDHVFVVKPPTESAEYQPFGLCAGSECFNFSIAYIPE